MLCVYTMYLHGHSFSANGVDDVSLKRPLNFTVVPLSSSRHSTLGNNGTVLTHRYTYMYVHVRCTILAWVFKDTATDACMYV